MNKKADVVRIYLPPDANTLLSVADHCLRSRNYINLIVAGKQPAPQWLTMDEAIAHCTTGLGVWQWASNDEGNPEVVMACCGDVPTMEALAAVMPAARADSRSAHPRGERGGSDGAAAAVGASARAARRGVRPHLSAGRAHDLRFPRLSVAAFTGSPTGGTTTTTCTCAATRKKAPPPLPSTCACSTTSTASSLTLDAIRRVPRLAAQVDAAQQWYSEQIQRHKLYVAENGDDLPEIKNWRWPES